MHLRVARIRNHNSRPFNCLVFAFNFIVVIGSLFSKTTKPRPLIDLSHMTWFTTFSLSSTPHHTTTRVLFGQRDIKPLHHRLLACILCDNTLGPSEEVLLLRSIRSLCCWFSSWKIKYVSRRLISQAHNQANRARRAG